MTHADYFAYMMMNMQNELIDAYPEDEEAINDLMDEVEGNEELHGKALGLAEMLDHGGFPVNEAVEELAAIVDDGERYD